MAWGLHVKHCSSSVLGLEYEFSLKGPPLFLNISYPKTILGHCCFCVLFAQKKEKKKWFSLTMPQTWQKSYISRLFIVKNNFWCPKFVSAVNDFKVLSKSVSPIIPIMCDMPKSDVTLLSNVEGDWQK